MRTRESEREKGMYPNLNTLKMENKKITVQSCVEFDFIISVAVQLLLGSVSP